MIVRRIEDYFLALILFFLALVGVGCSSTPISSTDITVTPTQVPSSEPVEFRGYDEPVETTDDEEVETDEYGRVELDTTKVRYQKYFDDMTIMSKNVDNTCYSPVSMNTALDVYSRMIKQDASYKELVDFIDNVDYLNYKSLPEDSKSIYRIINRIWVNNALNIDFSKCPAVADLAHYMDMSDSVKATAEKNQFVNDSTNGFIESTPTTLDEETVVDVMNIVYFKDKWMDGDLYVDPNPVVFHNSDGTKADVEMMSAKSGYYYENDSCYVVPLRYESGAVFYAIYVKDQRELLNLTDVISSKCFVDRPASIRLPEFEINQTIEATNYFSSIGLGQFQNCVPLFYGCPAGAEVTQVTRIRVDHEGTEAAAVTEIIMKNSIEVEKAPLVLTFDSPFAYMIQDVNGDIAFIGRVAKLG